MDNKIVEIETNKLDFDPKNPRFFRLNDASNAATVIEEMLDDESVHDLMLSIGQQGYFPGEPLLAVKSNGNYIVVEGNRRLAAVKLLNGDLLPPKRKLKGVQEIIDDTTNKPKKLPCIIYENREDVLRYIGYRHITGVKEWDSLSKAKYLKELCDTFYSHEPKEIVLKNLARLSGLQHFAPYTHPAPIHTKSTCPRAHNYGHFSGTLHVSFLPAQGRNILRAALPREFLPLCPLHYC